MAQPANDPAALRGLAHPTRIALLEALHLHPTLTATEASELIGVSPTNCAFHLRALARFGFVEQAGNGPGRRRPWRALEMPPAFSDVQDDPQARSAARALSDTLIQHWLSRTQAVQATRHTEPAEWLEVLGGSQAVVYATTDEVRTMIEDVRAVLSRYDGRLADPSQRPDGHRATEFLLFAQRFDPAETAGPGRRDQGRRHRDG